MLPAAERAGPEPTESRFDSEIDGFDHLSRSLVLLDARPLAELRRQVLDFAASLEAHVRGSPRGNDPTRDGVPASEAGAERLRDEHIRFLASVVELRGLLEVVVQEDHGGHRQALGQYGRLLVEALRRHRTEEHGTVPVPIREPTGVGGLGPRANRNEVAGEPAGES